MLSFDFVILSLMLTLIQNRPGKIARPMSIGRAPANKTSDVSDFSGAQILSFFIKIIKNYSRIGKTMKKL